VPAVDIAADGALPEELSEGMLRSEALREESGCLERGSPSPAKFLAFHAAKVAKKRKREK